MVDIVFGVKVKKKKKGRTRTRERETIINLNENPIVICTLKDALAQSLFEIFGMLLSI